MFTDRTINEIVKSVADSVEFEKVSDLTKEQFSEILSKSIYKSITNRDVIEQIYNGINMQMKRRR